MPFLSELHTLQIDDDYFRILSRLSYHDPIYNVTISVPVGFVSDGPSVPRVPVVYALCGHKGKKNAVIHDYLYRNVDHLAKAMYELSLFGPKSDCDRTHARYIADNIYLHSLQERNLVRLGLTTAIANSLPSVLGAPNYVNEVLRPKVSRGIAGMMYTGVRLCGDKHAGYKSGCLDSRHECDLNCIKCEYRDNEVSGIITIGRC